MFKNNWTLCRFYFKRDWKSILLWFGLILGLTIGFGAYIAEMYPDQPSLDAMVGSLDTPAFKAMLGQFFLVDGVLTLGGMYAAYMSVWLIIIVGCMSVAFIVRHTRKDEELGRLEVIRSLPVGRMSNLFAALTELFILNVLLAALIGLGLGAAGESVGRGMDFAGAFALGGACAAFGIVMAGITAVFCQLCKYPSTAMAGSFGFIGALYMIFMMGAMQDSTAVINISILGFLQQSEFFVINTPIPIIVTSGIGIAACAAALWLCKIRDLGESLIVSRPGKRDAGAWLKSPGALAWRILRPWVIFWALIIPILGLAYGSVMGEIDTFIESNEVFRQMSQGNPMVMASMFLLIGTVIGALPVLHFMLKARSEERRGYAENILARSASRSGQLRGYFIIALAAAVFVPVLNAVGFWAGSTAVMDDPIPFVSWLWACVVYTPALLVLLGVAVALVGWLPKLSRLAWGYLGYTFVALYLGVLTGLPEWLGKLTPFGHIPQLPYVEQLGEAPYLLADGTPLLDAAGVPVIMPVFADEATYALTGGNIAALMIMTAIAAGLFAVGFIGYKRRDMKFSQ